MSDLVKVVGRALLAVVVLVAVALPAGAASSLDDYRAQGVIAERYDGLVEIRGAAPPEAARLVEEVNAKRLAIYRERAETEKVPVAEVGKIYAMEIAGKAPAGTYFKKPDGSFVRK